MYIPLPAYSARPVDHVSSLLIHAPFFFDDALHFLWFSLQFSGEVHTFEQHHELEVGINPGT